MDFQKPLCSPEFVLVFSAFFIVSFHILSDVPSEAGNARVSDADLDKDLGDFSWISRDSLHLEVVMTKPIYPTQKKTFWHWRLWCLSFCPPKKWRIIEDSKNTKCFKSVVAFLSMTFGKLFYIFWLLLFFYFSVGRWIWVIRCRL